MIAVKVFTFSPIQENTYVLCNAAGECIVVDPGCYTDSERDALRHYLDKTARGPIRLLQTHCHLDHVFGTRWLAETYGLQPHIHPAEEPMLELAPVSGLMWNLPFDMYQGPYIPLQEGEIIAFGEVTLRVLFTPGHSPGHVCFYCPEEGFVIGGDVLFQGSIGRTDLPGGNQTQLLKSIREQLFTLPPETVVYPGHGPVTTVGEEMETNPFF